MYSLPSALHVASRSPELDGSTSDFWAELQVFGAFVGVEHARFILPSGFLLGSSEFVDDGGLILFEDHHFLVI